MIFGAFERLLAGRYLRARRQEGFVSVIAGFSLLGIALGVATLIIVMSVMSGFRTEFVAKILGLNAHLTVSTYGPVQDYPALAGRLRRVPGVVGVTPMVEGQALLTLNGYATGLQIRGLSPEDFDAKSAFTGKIVDGKAADFGDDTIAIGIRMAERLRLRVGDSITLISPKLSNTPFGGMLRKAIYKIGLIYSVGIFDADSSLVVMPLAAAQSFFQVGDGVTELDVDVSNPEAETAAAHRAIAAMLPADYRVIDWTQANQLYLNALDTERSVMFIILTLIIVVAAFNIISSLIMLVKDKGADIAILRTMGATRGMIMRIFFMAGAAIGVIGAAAGVLIGVLFVDNIENIRETLQRITGTDLFSAALYMFDQIPARLDWTQVATIVAMALALSFLASIVPAWRASRVDPVEALRYE
jgi:lipoprotein-releasing system permease protein